MFLSARTALASARSQAAAAAAAAAARHHPLHQLLARALPRPGQRAMGHGSHTSDNNPEVLAKEKQRNLEGRCPEVVPGTPGWNPALASESEAVVKAERAPSMDMEQLQQHSIEALGALESTHPDAAGTPRAHEGPVPGAHDPSGSQAIKDNLRYDKTQPGRQPE
ncbi:hypothetical protein Rsub_02962 [Raphidocelis subcapitata]|uniref:Uncharacterized protein n=1 Tax=Raphidocelis subcapitata TaxID=307507 RepID=A0A2V0NSZ9_9CHLO|nr:hypothetical protein Rsub_02962 [Raphidocelis subcapitata]|eukprot:GBF89792.1 hypothetical protein Rsub_02962 [Raphidocelis subcapitata]